MPIISLLLIIAVGAAMYYLGMQNGRKSPVEKTTVNVDDVVRSVAEATAEEPKISEPEAKQPAEELPTEFKKYKVNETPKHGENYWMTVLLYFASFLVGLGIVAEVAYNWNNITNAVKLVGAVVAMVGNAALLIWCEQKQKKVLKIVVACVFAFLIMGVIGLIGQVFQLQSNVANGCLLWAAVSWPLLLFVPSLLWLWLPFFCIGTRMYSVIFRDVIGLFIGQIDDSRIQQMLYIENVYLYTFSAVCLYGYFIIYELWVNSARKDDMKITAPLRFYSGVLMTGIYASVVETVHRFDAVAANLMVYVNLFTPYLLLALVIGGLNYVKRRFSFMPIFLVGTIFEALLLFQMHTNWFSHTFEMALPGVFVMLMLVYAYYHQMRRLRVLATLALIIWFGGTFEEDIFDLVPCLMMCAFFAFLAFKARNRRGFNTAVILAVLRILIYYADVEDLQYMGMYLIGSGILMIITIIGLMKYAALLWRNEDEK